MLSRRFLTKKTKTSTAQTIQMKNFHHFLTVTKNTCKDGWKTIFQISNLFGHPGVKMRQQRTQLIISWESHGFHRCGGPTLILLLAFIVLIVPCPAGEQRLQQGVLFFVYIYLLDLSSSCKFTSSALADQERCVQVLLLR